MHNSRQSLKLWLDFRIMNAHANDSTQDGALLRVLVHFMDVVNLIET